MKIDEDAYLTLNNFQRDVERTMMAEGDAQYYTIGLAGEVGEVSEIVKKDLYHDHPYDPVKLKKELGDVLFYVAALCSEYEFSLGEVARINIEKRAVRYPHGFEAARSLNKDESKE